MGGDVRAAPWRNGAIKVLTVAGIAGAAIAIGNSPIMVTAAETPPEIRRAERNDPAAGEIVIINRKADTKSPANSSSEGTAAAPGAKAKATSDKRAAAPDPYAPAPRRAEQRRDEAAPKQPATQNSSAPAEEKPASSSRAAAQPKAAPQSPRRADRAANPETAKPIDTPARVDGERRREQATAPLPPPPAVNTEPRTAGAPEAGREWSRSQAPASTPARRFGRDDADDPGPRRWAGRDRSEALYPPPGYRPRGQDWRYAERAPRWREQESRYYRDEGEGRPWRICRRLAWRCRDGFERACWRWQRQCR